jgi:hypothetical protein
MGRVIPITGITCSAGITGRTGMLATIMLVTSLTGGAIRSIGVTGTSECTALGLLVWSFTGPCRSVVAVFRAASAGSMRDGELRQLYRIWIMIAL